MQKERAHSMAKNTKRNILGIGTIPFYLIALSFFLVELFGFLYLMPEKETISRNQLWPLAFGGLWSVLLAGLVRVFTWQAGRVVFGIVYLLSFVYAAVQTGYYYIFGEMMWLSEFLYASEGTDYLDVLLSFPMGWYLWLVVLAAVGVVSVWKFPRWERFSPTGVMAITLCLACAMMLRFLPQKVFQQDLEIQHAGSDFGRAKSTQAMEAFINHSFHALLSEEV